MRLLGPVQKDLVFVGGSATGLLVTDPGSPPIRPTKDVDTIVEVGTLVDYHRFSNRLRQLGFREDMSDGAPICRWLHDAYVLDVMPTNPTILGFGNRWFDSVFHAAVSYELPSGTAIRVVPAPLFIATKLEAFLTRGKSDFLLSSDLEDTLAVLNGREAIVSEIGQSDPEIKSYLRERFIGLLHNPNFLDALPGHLPPDAISQGRQNIIRHRMQQVIDVTS